jgi:NTP pyrophosphatase (non-canonical NTP hydrolase)
MPSTTLEEMQAEVVAYCEAKGWNVNPVPFEAAMALLHEEAAEAGHAWRVWGLADATAGTTTERPEGHWNAKPEGLGSEFADILIRLLDDDARFGLGLIPVFRAYKGQHATHEHVLCNINALHVLIARASECYALGDGSHTEALAAVLSYLVQLCDLYGVNLLFEYRRKMDYNHKREYQHGGRRA